TRPDNLHENARNLTKKSPPSIGLEGKNASNAIMGRL
ncbi:hypothetical protein JDF658_26790, partial [Carboxydocella sp. JDF658]